MAGPKKKKVSSGRKVKASGTDVSNVEKQYLYQASRYDITPLSSGIVALFCKRAMDLLGSIVLLILFSPFMIGIAIAISLESKGGVFFKQKRSGIHCKEFMMYKFRSMRPHDTPQNQLDYIKEGDPRVTKVGAFIRKTSLDELPQLINVLKGEMSLVGPRPQPVFHKDHYPNIIPNYNLRHLVRPGVTSPVQVSEFRDDIDETGYLAARVALDIEYAYNRTLWGDIKILFMTFLKIFKRHY